MRRTVLLVTGGVSALVIATAGTAGVQALITGAQIKDGTIESRDIENGTIARADIGAATLSSLRGERGRVGAPGPLGAGGPQGAAGPQGVAGPQGPQGAGGVTGAQGPQGVKGDPGSGVHVTGSVPTAADLPAGAAEGDAYIVAATGHLHVRAGAVYVDTGLVRGPEGPAGPQGATGAIGAQGATGAIGAQGATGAIGPQGVTGAIGPQGPQGPQGPAGADGGLVGYAIVQGTAVAIAGTDFDVAVSVNCPPGKVAIGGGVSLGSPAGGVAMVESRPTALGAGWTVTVANFFDDPNSATPYAVCANSA